MLYNPLRPVSMKMKKDTKTNQCSLLLRGSTGKQSDMALMVCFCLVFLLSALTIFYAEARIENGNSQALTTRTHDGTVAVLGTSAAGKIYNHMFPLLSLISFLASFLHSRTYQGLDPRLGQDGPGILEQGRSGIARGYIDDRDQTKDV